MLDVEFRRLLDRFGVGQVASNSLLATTATQDDLRRGWKIALERADRRGLDESLMEWIRTQFGHIASDEASDDARALAAEVEAALRLSWVAPVVQIKARKRPTCDFRVGAFNVEVYCPQKHREERRVVEAVINEELKKAIGPVKIGIAIGHLTTGSGRRVDIDGRVVREVGSMAASFPANKLIDRTLSDKKREGRQFPDGDLNILWLDLKQGLGLSAIDCIPLRSVVAKGTCFVGMTGVWHAFYGQTGDPLFQERTALEYPVRPGSYPQQRDGWFREVGNVSCAIISVLDGLIRLDNPWAAVPLGLATGALLMRLSELRPEFSWFDGQARTLRMRVDAERRRIARLAK